MDNLGYDQLHVNPVEGMRREKRITSESFLSGGRDPFLSLNGEWRHSVDVYDNGLRAHWYREEGGEFERSAPKDYSFETWEPLSLPCSWNTRRKEYSLYEGSMWFFRTFPKIRLGGGERLILKIGAANYACMIFLNKSCLGCHEGGYTPFCVDITDFLAEENRLLLWVNNDRRPDGVPGDFTDWFNYGGVFRDIELYRVPACHLKDHFLHLVTDGNFDTVRLEVRLNRAEKRKFRLLIPGLLDGEGMTNEEGLGELVVKARPELWSPERPRLYSYCVECGEDLVAGTAGFREISKRGSELFLNGRKLFLRGVTAHEESVANGRALTEEERLSTLLLAKEMNCNFIRLAHYPHDERMALLADRLGILLWEEIPVYWALDFGNPETTANARNQLEELILRDRNRASVVVWAVGNENPDTEERFVFMKGLIDTARRLDPTRMVSAACLVDIAKERLGDRLAKEVDLIGINEYYGWYYSGYEKLERLFSGSFDRPVVVSEFGAEAVDGLHGGAGDVWTEEYQEEVYRNQFDVLLKNPNISGVAPWLLYDFKTPRRLNDHQRMYNLKGLVDRNKAVRKKAFYLVRRRYAEIEVIRS